MAEKRRECGNCSACCWTHCIEALSKPMHTTCAHQCAKGCAIYGDHPHECKLYLCGWRRGYGKDWHRPDLSGVVIDIAIEKGHPRIVLVESKPGALQTASGRMIAAMFEEKRSRFYTITVGGVLTKHIPRAQGELLELIRDTLGSNGPRESEVVYD